MTSFILCLLADFTPLKRLFYGTFRHSIWQTSLWQIQYKERPAVYGICLGEHNKIAIVKIGSKDSHVFDLPGGGIESDESEPEALIREFEEEVGLNVWPIRQLGRAGQFWINKEKPLNSLASFYEVEITGELWQPIEPDHCLIWLSVIAA